MSIVSCAVNLGGRSMYGLWSSVYHTDRRHLCTTRWAWGTASRGSVSGSGDLSLLRKATQLFQWAGRTTPKFSFPIGISTPANTWFIGPIPVYRLIGILVGSTVFAGLTNVTDRQTHRPRYSVYLVLWMHAMRQQTFFLVDVLLV